MLVRKHRLLAEKDFAKLFSKGKSVGGKALGLKFAPNQSGRSRIGFVVSTKVSKNAVDRNRIKRRLREIVRPFLPALASVGVDMAFMARSDAKKASFQELRDAVTYLLDKSGLLKK